jgi:hypothetical protein
VQNLEEDKKAFYVLFIKGEKVITVNSEMTSNLVTTMAWTPQQRAFTVKTFHESKSYVTTQREYRRYFAVDRNNVVPSAHAIKTWVHNFQETGSALKRKPPGSQRTVRTEANIAAVRVSVERSPRRSAHHHASTLRLSDRSVRRILHLDCKFHPYKIQVVQELKERDLVARTQYCREMLARMEDDEDFIHNLFMSDEAHFHLSGFVNKQNFRYWAIENPKTMHEKPLHCEKVTVWCALSAFGIIGPYFFEDDSGKTVTVNSQRYVHMIQTFLTQQLLEFHENTDNVWFQQDGATSHTARIAMDAVNGLFQNRLISRYGNISWPARSPDLSACDYFLWGHLKSKVYEANIHTTDELKTKIREEIRTIPQDMCRRVMDNMRPRFQECLRMRGGHLQDIVFKT